jgi:hypothetical protein
MTNRAFTKIYASTVAPDPKMNIIWMDLTANAYGKTLKYWNGQTWVEYLEALYLENTNLLNPGLSGNITLDGTISIYNISTYESAASASADSSLENGVMYMISDTGALMIKL